MVKMLDDHVGLIMAELKTQGIDENTIVIFTSDNGHELYYGPKKEYREQFLADGKKANLTNRKWRTSECGDVFDGAGGRAGLKRSGYQGGMQCPLIARWPGKIAPKTETSLLSAHYDFMATLADICGGKVPAGKDSISYLPTLLGQPQEKKHDYLIINNQFTRMGSSALIAQDGMKVVEANRKEKRYQLYNILTDNEERHELSKQHPQRLKDLRKTLQSELNSKRPDLP